MKCRTNWKRWPVNSVRRAKALVAYVAAPHAGYLRMFREHSDAVPYVLGEGFIKEFKPLVRNLPAPKPWEVRKMLNGLDIFHTEEHGKENVRILEPDNLDEVRTYSAIVMPDEDVSRALAERHFTNCNVVFVDWRLRWDWGASQKNERPADRLISHEEFDREIMQKLDREAARSSDWWRQVGATLVRDGKIVIMCFNKHMPSEHIAYLKGDPRSSFEQGASIEVSVASHAERRVQAIAARDGVSTQGCDLYVTTFPCPPCTYAWAESGIRRLYYRDGYSNLEAAPSLKANDIEIIRVE